MIVTVSSGFGSDGECETETEGACVSMLDSPIDDPIEHKSVSVLPSIIIFVAPFMCVFKTVKVKIIWLKHIRNLRISKYLT